VSAPQAIDLTVIGNAGGGNRLAAGAIDFDQLSNVRSAEYWLSAREAVEFAQTLSYMTEEAGGIARDNLADDVKATLDKADTAVQLPPGGGDGQVLVKSGAGLAWATLP